MCFAFNSTTGTITDYYYYENNVSTNPACPRDVIIPSKINGVAVTIIGDNSFNGNQLTSISIPNSVTNIKLQAFIANKLTDVVIPNGVTLIETWTFCYNYITQGNFQIDNISGGVTIEENILLWNGANKGVNTITPTYLR